jgi:hypothetical protein
MQTDTAPVTDNRPLLPDFDATRRALEPDFTWFSVEACEAIAPLRELLRDEEETR